MRDRHRQRVFRFLFSLGERERRDERIGEEISKEREFDRGETEREKKQQEIRRDTIEERERNND